MTLRSRVDLIDRDVIASLLPELTPEGKSKALAAFAREQFDQADRQNTAALGSQARHETYVDGRLGAPLETVRPDGSVLFEWQLLGDLFEWIEAQLILNAPVKTGRFSKSFVFFADGVEAKPTRPPQATEFVFLSSAPYAGKIERGLSRQAPDGVFEVIAVLARRRFGNLAQIKFSYRSPLLSYVGLGGRKGGKTAGRAKRSAHNIERNSRTPAIVISVR
jgi:hypothetical protein